MRTFTSFLRTSFFLLIACLGTLAQAQTAPPSHAHRYPDAVVVKVWTPTGEIWLRLEPTALGYYHGSIEFDSVGWMSSVTEYYEFTCQMTMDVRDCPFRFHHEFRDKDGYDASPSDFWTELRYDWELAEFTQPEYFGVYFDDPVVVEQPSAAPPALAGGSGTAGVTQPGKPLAAPPPAPAPPSPASPPSPAAQGSASAGPAQPRYDSAGYDADGYDQHGVDRQGFNRDGVYIGLFDAEDYDSDGYDRQGYDRHGRDRDGYDYEGFNAAGFSRFGGYLYGYDQVYTAPNTLEAQVYDERGFDQGGLNLNGTNYDDAGYDLWGYDKDGYNSQGVSALGAVRAVPASSSEEQAYDARGFASNGLHQNGTYYDDLGYDYFGYDSRGFDSAGYDRGGYDETGWNRLGIDTEGYDRDGRNARGFNRYGIHRNTTLYDEQGFDMQGYNRQGVHYVAGDYTKPTPPPPVATTGGGGWTDRQKTLADLLDGEGFPFRPADLSDREVGEILQKYGSVDNMTAEQWAELNQACLAAGLTKLWADLDDRIALVNLGFSDEDTDVLRAKQSQIEEYFQRYDLAGAPSVIMPKVIELPRDGFGPTVGGAAAMLSIPDGQRGMMSAVGQWMAEHQKFMGFVRAVGGLAEVVGGAVATAGTGGTGAALGIPLILHGVDQFVAGAAQAITGEQTHSRLEKIVSATAESAGISPQKAEMMGSLADAGTGIILTAGVGAGPALTRAVATEVEVANTVAKEVEVGTTVAKAAAGGGKVLLAAEDCNAAGLKRLFDSLPQKVTAKSVIGYVNSEEEVLGIWTKLKASGTGLVEVEPGKFRVVLSDGTFVTFYKSTTDGTFSLGLKIINESDFYKIHVLVK